MIEPECRPDDLGPGVVRAAWELAGSSGRSLEKFLHFNNIFQEEEKGDTLLDWRYKALSSCGSVFTYDIRGTRRQKVKDIESTGRVNKNELLAVKDTLRLASEELVADLRTQGGEDDGKNWETKNKWEPQTLCQGGSLLVAGKPLALRKSAAGNVGSQRRLRTLRKA